MVVAETADLVMDMQEDDGVNFDSGCDVITRHVE